MIVRPRGSRPGSAKNPIGSTEPGISRPVSSRSSRLAAASAGSSIPRKPPGIAHVPGERFAAATDKQNAERALDKSKNHQVDRDLGTWVLVAIRGWHGTASCGTMQDSVSPGIVAFEVIMSKSPVKVPAWSEPDPDEPRIAALVASLAQADGPADLAGTWPQALWSLVQQAGATRWSLDTEFGGAACPRPLLVQRYARLAEVSLTAVFILSQHDAAVRRLMNAADKPKARQWLEAIGSGQAFATVGISQLTTSRRLALWPWWHVRSAPDASSSMAPCRG